MPTNTYVELDKVTVSGSAVTDITFTNINQTYTDLIIIIHGHGAVQDGYSVLCQVGNGSIDTASNYSTTRLGGNGSTVTTGRATGANYMRLQNLGGQSTTSANKTTIIAEFMNYSNTTMNKTVLNKASQTVGSYPAEEAVVNLWRSTSAINTIKIFPFTGASFAVGSTFSLYGIRAEGVSPTSKATGGAIYSDDTYYYHAFGSSGTFTPSQSLTADVLCIAGGGGGGTANRGGGGGAGGIIYFASQSLSATGYSITVGAGGTQFGQGNNSQFASLTVASGGGRGGASNFGGAYLATAGGSGGGNGNDGTNNGGASNQSATGATAIYGNRGGNVTVGGDVAGGGGSGAAGTDGVNSNNGIAGGIGTTAFTTWGLATGVGQFSSGNYYIAAGGAGGANYSGGGSLFTTRALGGGGINSSDSLESSGLQNTGSGGSGFSYNSGSNTYPAGFGGSGVVIVRYLKA